MADLNFPIFPIFPKQATEHFTERYFWLFSPVIIFENNIYQQINTWS